MKKLIVVSFFLISICVSGQVELTPGGLTFEGGESYKVYDFEGKSKDEIYKSALVALSKMYVSPKDVISEVEGEQLTVNAISKNTIRRNRIHTFDINYTLIFQFKDEKMRVDAPSINSMTNWLDLKLQHLYIVSGQPIDGTAFGIYNKKRELKIDRAKQDVELLFNVLIGEVVAGMQTKDDSW